jgi:protein TonB
MAHRLWLALLLLPVILMTSTAVAQEQFAGVDPVSRRDKPPKYPAEAISACTSFSTVIIVNVDKSGGFTKAIVEKPAGNVLFDQAAIEASRHWKYYSEVEAGERKASRIRIPVYFPEHASCWDTVEPDTPAQVLEASVKAHPLKWPAVVEAEDLNGFVLLKSVVETDGSVRLTKVGISSGWSMIDDAASSAAAQWKYEPALVDGKPVRSVIEYTLYFGKGSR